MQLVNLDNKKHFIAKCFFSASRKKHENNQKRYKIPILANNNKKVCKELKKGNEQDIKNKWYNIRS